MDFLWFSYMVFPCDAGSVVTRWHLGRSPGHWAARDSLGRRQSLEKDQLQHVTRCTGVGATTLGISFWVCRFQVFQASLLSTYDFFRRSTQLFLSLLISCHKLFECLKFKPVSTASKFRRYSVETTRHLEPKSFQSESGID